MQKLLKKGFVLWLSLILTPLAALSGVKVELTGFGKINLNLSFPSSIQKDSLIADLIMNIPNREWRTFLTDPVLEQKTGMGFGGRISVELTPRIALEGTLEYVLAELQFKPDTMKALKTKMESIGYSPYMSYKDSGGNITRFYVNVNYEFPWGKMIPYVTAGMGLTKFKAGPSIKLERMDFYDEKSEIHYNDESAFTLNGGFGLKVFFTPNIGLRIDARIFSSSLEFEQSFGYKWLGNEFIPEDTHVKQSGSHLDSSLNLGIIFKL